MTSGPQLAPSGHYEAKSIIEQAVSSIAGLAEITTAPTEDQWRALTSLIKSSDVAPRRVCDALDLEPGSDWGVVVVSIIRDAQSAGPASH